MKRFLYILLAITLLSGCSADYNVDFSSYKDDLLTSLPESAFIPIKIDDPEFNIFCIESYDSFGRGFVSEYEASMVTRMDCSGRGIKSLEGIEQFTNLDTLICKENLLESINLSRTGVSVLYAYPMDDAGGRNLLDYLYILKGQEIEYVTSGRKSAPDKRIPDGTVVVAIPAAKMEINPEAIPGEWIIAY